MPQTLLQMMGVKREPIALSQSALIVVDAQKEYLSGKLPLKGIDGALDQIGKLLERARKVGNPVIFMRHMTNPEAPLFNPESDGFQIIDAVAPRKGEIIIDKKHPSSFSGTNLDDLLHSIGRDKLIVTGFMTHACISATVRSGSELGYEITVVDSACATRDLPKSDNSTMTAEQIHDTTLVALSDLFAHVVKTSDDIPN